MGPTWMLTGAAGNLARQIRAMWPQHFPGQPLVLVDRANAALDTPQAVADLLNHVRPDHILHCAAISNPLACETRPEAATHLHRDVTAQFARHTARCSGWMLHCSTDFVFAGDTAGRRREDDPAEPLNHYGRTKLAGEQAVLAEGCGLVARLSLLHSPPVDARNGSWQRVLADLAADAPVMGVVDEWRTPISYADAAGLILTLAARQRTGLLHVGGPDVLSPHDLISRLAARVGSRSRVIPVSRDTFMANQLRPRNVALATDRLAAWLGCAQPRAA